MPGKAGIGAALGWLHMIDITSINSNAVITHTIILHGVLYTDDRDGTCQAAYMNIICRTLSILHSVNSLSSEWLINSGVLVLPAQLFVNCEKRFLNTSKWATEGYCSSLLST